MPTATRTFRVFISSTFEDLKEERNALQVETIPKLRELCLGLGARFQAIDLRWGVRDEAALDQRTMDICLREIEHCQMTGIQPNFVILLGDRYGWQPLPSRIPAEEFDPRPIAGDWYRLDENAVPSEFVLQPRTSEFIDPVRWHQVEDELRPALAERARAAGVTGKALSKYTDSATHQEILAGLGKSEEYRKHVLGFVRHQSGEADARLDEIRKVIPRVTEFQPGDLRNLCEVVYTQLAEIIEMQAKQFAADDTNLHDAFGAERARIFTGRAAELKSIARYLTDDERRPLVVYGPSGSGKSALLAKASLEHSSSARVFRRFIGAVPAASNGHSLLTGFCQELEPREDMPTDFFRLAHSFQEVLARAGAVAPIALFIDGLDQLPRDDPGRSLVWLPRELPPGVKVVVSTTPEEEKLPPGVPLAVGPMATEEAADALDAWLSEDGRARTARTLQLWQRRKVLDAFARCRLPLYLKLAAEESRSWTSYAEDADCRLGEGVAGIIGTLFARLAETDHGPVLVGRALGYLAAARYGLAEDELLDVLTNDDAVWEDFDRHRHHEVGRRQLPTVVWSKLGFDLSPYLSERAAPGGIVISFLHRQIAERSAEGQSERHADLAYFFSKQSAWLDARRKVPNARAASELPFQQRASENWSAAKATLLDPACLTAKCAAGLVTDLEADYRALPAAEQDETIRLIREALVLSMHVVVKDGRQYASQMVGRLMGFKGRDAVTKFVSELTAASPRPWLRPMRAGLKAPGGALIRSLGSHALRVNSVSILDDGSVAASGGQDGVVHVHRLRDQSIQFLSGHTDEINAVLVSRIGEELIVVSSAGKRLPFKLMMQFKGFVERTDTRTSRDNTIRVWNVADGTLRHTLEGHTAAVRSLASRSRLLLSGSDDGTIRMWDLQEGKSLGILGSQGAPVVLLVMIPELLAVVAFSEYDFQLWDINERRGTGKSQFDYYWQNVLALEPEPMLVALQDTTVSGDAYRLKIWDIRNSAEGRENFSTVDSFKHSFNSAQFVGAGKEILVGGTDQIIRLYDVASAEELGQYSRHNSEVTSLAVAEEAGNIVSGAADGEVLLWNLNCREQPDRPDGHSDDVNSVAVSADGLTATSACQDGSAIVWNAPSASLIRTFFPGGRSLRCTAISGDGRLAAFGGEDGTISVREIETGNEIVSLAGHRDTVSCVAFCNGDTAVVSGSHDKIVRIWRIADPGSVQVLEGHEQGIRALACSNRGEIAVTGDESGRLIVWDILHGRQLRRVETLYDPVELEQSTQALWAVASGPEWQTSPDERRAPCIESLAISPDDRWLIVGQREKPISVLDLQSGAELLKLVGHTGIVFGLSVTAGGRRLVSAADDRSMRVWDLPGGSCVAAFTADWPLYTCAADAAGKMLVVGEGAYSGKVHFLSLVGDGDSGVS